MQNKSFLRWAGSKQKLIPVLKQYWNTEFTRYLEPFMGSAKLFFSIDTNEALLSDTNKELVDVFLQVQKNPNAVFKVLKTFKVSKKKYYQIRNINTKTLGVNQRAARFIYLNQLCFNGLYRTNASGIFNVPYSGENNIQLDELFKILKITSRKLLSAKILCGDFEQIVLDNLKENDFVYLDPPYAVGNRQIFKQYGPQTFGLDDLKRLKQLLNFIDSKNAYFLLSYAYCKEALDLFSEWNMQKKFVQRNIAGFSINRRKAAELLITNIDNPS